VQGGRIGLASYHFVSPTDCYISYEHAPGGWTLEDGSSPPARKPFLSPSYDAATRTFTGLIDWAPSTFGGDQRWEYTMVFSDSHDTIVGGHVNSYKRDGSAGTPMRFGRSDSMLRALGRLLRGGQLEYERHDEARSEMMALMSTRSSQPAAPDAPQGDEHEDADD